MSGQIDLNAVIKSLQVNCDDVEYGYSTGKNREYPLSEDILGIFRENEGLTLIATKKYLELNCFVYEGPFAKLTITVHTSLKLVGLTAALSKQLTEHGIPANIVAGFYHDHIFVPYELRQKGIEAINQFRDVVGTLGDDSKHVRLHQGTQ